MKNTIGEIIGKYENFSDALIYRFEYCLTETSRNVKLSVRCMNRLLDYEYEDIEICFIDVISFRFVEKENQTSTCVNAAFIGEFDGIITFDFYPLLFENEILKENEESDFVIKCRGISYSQAGAIL